MKIGFVSNGNIRNRSGNQCDRLFKNIKSAKLDILILNGNYTGQGYDLRENIEQGFRGRGLIVLFNLGPKDFQNTEVGILKHVENLESWANSNKNDKFAHFSNFVLPVGETALMGVDGWFDGLNLSEKIEVEEFNNILEFTQNKNLKDRQKLCEDVAKNAALDLAERLEACYKNKPKKIFIFTPFGGSEKSMDFGGKNSVPQNTRGMFLNRFIYPSIKKLISSNKSIRHVLIAGSPLGNNTNMIAPNFKEVLCCSASVNKEGKKDIGLHTLMI